ncbi:MAG TPA: translation initiation factor IF-1, partial [Candidatus Acidoferrales bacterium]|nr:translation initiation factor IF-1 [Candidatus Acidoferrales bacterium]
ARIWSQWRRSQSLLIATFCFGDGARATGLRNSPILLLKEQSIEVEGTVKMVLPGTMFRVELDNQHLVLAVISGKMRKKFVRLTAGDRVKMQMSPYDLDKARITWRLR